MSSEHDEYWKAECWRGDVGGYLADGQRFVSCQMGFSCAMDAVLLTQQYYPDVHFVMAVTDAYSDDPTADPTLPSVELYNGEWLYDNVPFDGWNGSDPYRYEVVLHPDAPESGLWALRTVNERTGRELHKRILFNSQAAAEGNRKLCQKLDAGQITPAELLVAVYAPLGRNYVETLHMWLKLKGAIGQVENHEITAGEFRRIVHRGRRLLQGNLHYLYCVW